MRRAAKWIAIIVGVVILLPGVVYIPFVQDFAVRKAVDAAEAASGMKITFGRARLRFPLRIEVRDAVALTPGGDTLLRCGGLTLRAALWPLLRGEARIDDFSLTNTSLHYRNSLATLDLAARIDTLAIDAGRVFWGRDSVAAARLALAGGSVDLTLHPAPDTTASAGFPWRFRVDSLDVRRIDFRMESFAGDSLTTALTAALGRGGMTGGAVDIARQTVAIQHVGLYNPLCNLALTPVETPAPSPDSAAPPWDIRLERVRVAEGAFGYNDGLVAVTGFGLGADSVRSYGNILDVNLLHLTLQEHRGLQIDSARGRIALDPERYALRGFELHTAKSHFAADGQVDATVVSAAREGSVSLRLDGAISTDEVEILLPGTLPRALSGTVAGIAVEANGDTKLLTINKLHTNIPARFALRASGTVASPLDPPRAAAHVRFDAAFHDIAFLKSYIPDTALRRRIDIPHGITAAGRADLSRSAIGADLALGDGAGGRAAIDGRVQLREKSYDARIATRNFDLARFLPADSIGKLSLELRAHGAGFDPYDDRTALAADLHIDSAEWYTSVYRDATLEASLAHHAFGLRIESGDPGADLTLGANGILSRDSLAAVVNTGIRNLDLHKARIAADTTNLALNLTLDAGIASGKRIRALVRADSIVIGGSAGADTIRRTRIDLAADSVSVALNARSGDLVAAFKAPSGIDSLVAAAGRIAGEIQAQVADRNLDFDRLWQQIPEYDLAISTGQRNPLRRYLRSQGMGLWQGEVRSSPRGTTVNAVGLQSGSLTVDTLRLAARPSGDSLLYNLHLANSATHGSDQLGAVAVVGSVRGDALTARVTQRNKKGAQGIDVTLAAEASDSTLILHILSPEPTLAYGKWRVNPGNHVTIDKGAVADADFTLTQDSTRIVLQSQGAGAVNLDVAGFDPSKTLAPFLGGSIPKGVFGARVAYRRTAGNHAAQGEITVDGKSAITLDASYGTDTNNPVSLKATIPGLPLGVLNALLPPKTASLDGTLRGELTASGTASKLDLEGQLAFDATRVSIPPIGTAYTLDNRPIAIKNSRLLFDRFALTAPDKSTLTVDGNLDLRNLSQPVADLAVQAQEFEVFNVARGGKSIVWGKAYVKLDATAKGPLDRLAVRGDVRVLDGTNAVYVLQDSPVGARNKRSDVVIFRSFADTVDIYLPVKAKQVDVTGMSVLATITVDRTVELAMFLTPDGQDRINLKGGGDLVYNLDRQGVGRFTGKYTLDGGTVNYAPPVIAEKTFDITPGSTVEWSGEVANPTMKITATESVRANVATDGQSSRQVVFNIIINIANSLRNLALTLDLASPDDIGIQNQLSSLTPEQRSTQAMNMLVYNTYTGPGTTATKVTASSPLNAFMEKELNQWAQNTIRGVDLSFGVDTYQRLDTGGETTHTDYSYKISKNLFDNRVRFYIGGKFTTDDPTENQAANLLGDISVEYQLSKHQNRFLKAFHNSTYESIVEGEVTRTGLGFVVRKKLARLADLFRSEKRQQRKATEAAKTAEE